MVVQRMVASVGRVAAPEKAACVVCGKPGRVLPMSGPAWTSPHGDELVVMTSPHGPVHPACLVPKGAVRDEHGAALEASARACLLALLRARMTQRCSGRVKDTFAPEEGYLTVGFDRCGARLRLPLRPLVVELVATVAPDAARAAGLDPDVHADGREEARCDP